MKDPSARIVRCECRKALGTFWDDPYNTDRVYAAMTGGVATWSDQPRESGLADLFRLAEHGDWFSIVCKHCGHDWQGRQHQLRALIHRGNDREVSLRNM